jgi:hypothetical protein
LNRVGYGKDGCAGTRHGFIRWRLENRVSLLADLRNARALVSERTVMKRRAERVGVVTIGVALAIAVVWRASSSWSEQAFSAPCTYYAGNCASIAALPVGRIQLIP